MAPKEVYRVRGSPGLAAAGKSALVLTLVREPRNRAPNAALGGKIDEPYRPRTQIRGSPKSKMNVSEMDLRRVCKEVGIQLRGVSAHDISRQPQREVQHPVGVNV